MSSKAKVLIIGSGPSGLAMAHCLAQRGISFSLFEKGDRPLAALRRVDPNMRLISPYRISRLPGTPLPGDCDTYPRFEDFLDDIEAGALRSGIQIITGATATRVRPRKDGVEASLSIDGESMPQTLVGTHVVNASGIIHAPVFPPSFDEKDCEPTFFHSLDVRASHLRKSRRLLVVGGGASAVEVIERWLEVRRSDDHAWLSLRSPMIALWNPILGVDPHYWGWLPEHLPVKLFGKWAYLLKEPMLGRLIPRAIKRGLVTRLPAFRGVTGSRVSFENGESLQPDTIVFATGFRYDTRHLEEMLDYDAQGRPRVVDCRSVRDPRLFLMGFRFGRTFMSPYFRGMMADAEKVARQIAKESR